MPSCTGYHKCPFCMAEWGHSEECKKKLLIGFHVENVLRVNDKRPRVIPDCLSSMQARHAAIDR